MNENKGLAGRNVLVAGATSGMGRATAYAAASAGAKLVLLGRDKARLDEIGRATAEIGAPSVTCIQVDAANYSALCNAYLRNSSAVEAIDTLVNSVGVNIAKRAFVDLTTNSWASMIDRASRACS